jgi:hypothetical protein
VTLDEFNRAISEAARWSGEVVRAFRGEPPPPHSPVCHCNGSRLLTFERPCPAHGPFREVGTPIGKR